MPNIRIIAAFATLVTAITPARAQDWPTRPVTMVLPFAAGGPLDVVGRLVAARLSQILDQQVVVENVTGAGGMIGGNRVAKAASDGYQFVFGHIGTHAFSQTLYKKPLYDAVNDFAPVIIVNHGIFLLIVRKEFPANTLAEFIAYAKANQGKMQFGSAGPGSINHMACVLLILAMDTNITHVPYRGTAPAMQDLIGGRIDFMCDSLVTALPQIQRNAVKATIRLSKTGAVDDLRTKIAPSAVSATLRGLLIRLLRTQFTRGSFKCGNHQDRVRERLGAGADARSGRAGSHRGALQNLTQDRSYNNRGYHPAVSAYDRI
jgi:tripartite-type tricarboxylate transporter receptor subunit TctC